MFYLLKHRPRNWQNIITTTFSKIGFYPLISDESTYYNKELNTFIITYVDDFLLFGITIKEINLLKKKYRIILK